MSQPIKAIIFDLDGTLIDSERRTLAAYLDAGRELGVSLTEEMMLGLIGLDSRASKQRLAEQIGVPFSYEDLRARAHAIRDQTVLHMKPGAREILEFLRGTGLPCGIATSTRAKVVEEILDAMELRKYIAAFVAGDQVKRGKPDPEIYLSAARALGVEAAECLAFEDSEPGLRSAVSAGMRVVHVPDMLVLPKEVLELAVAVEASLVSAKSRLEKLVL